MYAKIMCGLLKLQNWWLIGATTPTVDDLLNKQSSAANQAGGALEEVDGLVKEYGAGIFNIGRNVFIYILAFGLLVSAAAMIIHGNNVSKRSEEKSGFGWKLAGGVLGFAVVSIVILLQTIGSNLFTP